MAQSPLVCRLAFAGYSERSDSGHQEKLPLPPRSVETVAHRWFCSLESPEVREFTMGRSVFELPVVEKFKSIGLVSGKGVCTGHDLVGGHMRTRLRQSWPLLTVVLPIPLKKKNGDTILLCSPGRP